MGTSDLLPVGEARARVLANQGARGTERVPLAEALGRTLTEPLVARRTQPPFAASAMDGFAVRAADLASLPARLKVIGESAAGHGFDGSVAPGEAVRIFTGAPVPPGADSVLMQEDTTLDGNIVTAQRTIAMGRHIRTAGVDFSAGESLLPAGTRLGPIDIALAAAMGHAEVAVARKPRVAILATGDELVQPGQETVPIRSSPPIPSPSPPLSRRTAASPSISASPAMILPRSKPASSPRAKPKPTCW